MKKLNTAALSQRIQNGVLETRNLTLGELTRLYTKHATFNEPRNYRLKKWLEILGSERIAWEIPPAEFHAVLDEMTANGYAASTVNRELGDWLAIFNWAIKKRRYSGCPEGFTNPFTGYERREEAMRRVSLSEEETDNLLALSQQSTYPRMYGLVLAAITSGGRKNELLRMTWAGIDWESGVASIGIDNKSGQYRTLILTSEVMAELKKYTRHGPDARVFCAKGDPYRA